MRSLQSFSISLLPSFFMRQTSFVLSMSVGAVFLSGAHAESLARQSLHAAIPSAGSPPLGPSSPLAAFEPALLDAPGLSSFALALAPLASS